MEIIGAATVIPTMTTFIGTTNTFTIILRPYRLREGPEADRLCWWVLQKSVYYMFGVVKILK